MTDKELAQAIQTADELMKIWGYKRSDDAR